jgi:hypothetical protein
MKRYYFNIFADYFQFDLVDEDSESPVPVWTEKVLADRVAVFERAITVETARNMPVPVVIELHEEPCSADSETFDTWDHVTECGIKIPSGKLVIIGNEYRPEAPRIEVSPGNYQVRIYHGGIESLRENDLAGNDVYLVVIYPGDNPELHVLKQYQP